MLLEQDSLLHKLLSCVHKTHIAPSVTSWNKIIYIAAYVFHEHDSYCGHSDDNLSFCCVTSSYVVVT